MCTYVALRTYVRVGIREAEQPFWQDLSPRVSHGRGPRTPPEATRRDASNPHLSAAVASTSLFSDLSGRCHSGPCGVDPLRVCAFSSSPFALYLNRHSAHTGPGSRIALDLCSEYNEPRPPRRTDSGFAIAGGRALGGDKSGRAIWSGRHSRVRCAIKFRSRARDNAKFFFHAPGLTRVLIRSRFSNCYREKVPSILAGSGSTPCRLMHVQISDDWSIVGF